MPNRLSGNSIVLREKSRAKRTHIHLSISVFDVRTRHTSISASLSLSFLSTTSRGGVTLVVCDHQAARAFGSHHHHTGLSIPHQHDVTHEAGQRGSSHATVRDSPGSVALPSPPAVFHSCVSRLVFCSQGELSAIRKTTNRLLMSGISCVPRDAFEHTRQNPLSLSLLQGCSTRACPVSCALF